LGKSKIIAYGLAAWLIVEAIAFVLVVQILGVVAALALGLGTTLLGLADVKRLFDYLKIRVARPKEQQKAPGAPLDGALQAFAALLLILPGFASDLVGLALKAPSIRSSVAERLKNRADGPGPRTIDLAPTEWKHIDAGQRRRRRTKRTPAADAQPASPEA
jgi:UPF0716 protein FxsA